MAKNQRRKEHPKLPFHKRFDIDVAVDDARQHFINRVLTIVPRFMRGHHTIEAYKLKLRHIAYLLGERYYLELTLENCVNNDFYQCLRTLEAAYEVIDTNEKQAFSQMVEEILSLSAVDLDIRWENGEFYPSGAKLLDDKIVNEALRWLSAPQYRDSLSHFDKGLKDFTQAQNNPKRLEDVIGDMYKALESMARIVCNNTKGWKANAELFVSKLGLSTHYSKMLKEHGEYLHEFRHGSQIGRERKLPSKPEVEASIYTTGLFLRLAIEKIDGKRQ